MVFTKCDCGFAVGVFFHSPQIKSTILESQVTKGFLSFLNKNWLVEFSVWHVFEWNTIAHSKIAGCIVVQNLKIK